MEKTCYNNIKYPLIISNNNESSFAFRYEFSKHLGPFLSSGLLTDYISIKLIKSNLLAILSTKPAVELNIINSNLFFYDRSYSLDSFISQKPLLWVDAFPKDKFYELKYKKMDIFGFTSAISIYYYDQDKMVSVSFASYLNNKDINEYYLSNLEYLNKIAYIVETISLPMFSQIFMVNLDHNSSFTKGNLKLKSKIFLAINNTERIL
jgi:hypothetical protein